MPNVCAGNTNAPGSALFAKFNDDLKEWTYLGNRSKRQTSGPEKRWVRKVPNDQDFSLRRPLSNPTTKWQGNVLVNREAPEPDGTAGSSIW
jgi:hypothetical protein